MTEFNRRFEARCAVITGGASGLGKQAAKRIVAEGGKVALWDINADALSQAKLDVRATHTVALDITDPKMVAAAAKESADALGKIDILVTAAGITGATAPVHEYPVESWQRVIDINLNGMFYCCRAIVPFMLQNGYGRIVNIASVAGKEGNPNASHYSASKAGLIGLTKSLGKELATRNILVNAVTPAACKTEIFDSMSQQHIDYMLTKIPMNRFLMPDEAASLILWLASEDCAFSTGSVFDLSGGRATY